MKLWEIGAELEALSLALAENGGELTPAMESLLEKLEGDFDAKAENVALAIRIMEAQSAAAEEEEKRIKRIRTGYANGAKRLRKYLHEQMHQHERGKIETPRVRLRIKRSSQPSVHFVGTDRMTDIPEEFMKIPDPVLDKARVLKAWTATSPDPYARSAPEGFEVKWSYHVAIS